MCIRDSPPSLSSLSPSLSSLLLPPLFLPPSPPPSSETTRRTTSGGACSRRRMSARGGGRRRRSHSPLQAGTKHLYQAGTSIVHLCRYKCTILVPGEGMERVLSARVYLYQEKPGRRNDVLVLKGEYTCATNKVLAETVYLYKAKKKDHE
eukprot:719848-Rhodomonas_salina.1